MVPECFLGHDSILCVGVGSHVLSLFGLLSNYDRGAHNLSPNFCHVFDDHSTNGSENILAEKQKPADERTAFPDVWGNALDDAIYRDLNAHQVDRGIVAILFEGQVASIC